MREGRIRDGIELNRDRRWKGRPFESAEIDRLRLNLRGLSGLFRFTPGEPFDLPIILTVEKHLIKVAI